MAAGKPLDTDAVEAIKALVLQDVGATDIAKLYDLHPQSIHRLARKHGWKPERQTVDPHKTKQLLTILRTAAEAGDKCPTNVEIGAQLGFKSRSTASQAVEKLAKQGLIKIDRYGRDFRQITFLDDGTCTAPPPAHRYRKSTKGRQQNARAKENFKPLPMLTNDALEPIGTQEPIGCRMIATDVILDPDWKYCGRKQKPGSSWCPVHHEMCYDKARSLHPDLQ